MNREQRRHPEKLEEPDHREPTETPDRELSAAERAPDDFDVRAKSTGHKKKTADKWNQ
jgi:hypothetical protein